MSAVETLVAASPRSIMSIKEAQDLERKQAFETDYYAVYLRHDPTEEIVRVRTPVWLLDANRNIVTDASGTRQQRNAHDVALDVWAAYGADEYTLDMVMRGSYVVATPASIANELQMKRLTLEEPQG